MKWQRKSKPIKTPPPTLSMCCHVYNTTSEVLLEVSGYKKYLLFSILEKNLVQFSHSLVSDSATPWIAACQVSLSIPNSQSVLKSISIKSVMPSSHLILCHPLLFLPSIPPSIRVFSNESALRMRWPKPLGVPNFSEWYLQTQRESSHYLPSFMLLTTLTSNHSSLLGSFILQMPSQSVHFPLLL